MGQSLSTAFKDIYEWLFGHTDPPMPPKPDPDPVDPIGPIGPVDPVDPIKPIGPVDPVRPEDLIELLGLKIQKYSDEITLQILSSIKYNRFGPAVFHPHDDLTGLVSYEFSFPQIKPYIIVPNTYKDVKQRDRETSEVSKYLDVAQEIYASDIRLAKTNYGQLIRERLRDIDIRKTPTYKEIITTFYHRCLDLHKRFSNVRVAVLSSPRTIFSPPVSRTMVQKPLYFCGLWIRTHNIPYGDYKIHIEPDWSVWANSRYDRFTCVFKSGPRGIDIHHLYRQKFRKMDDSMAENFWTRSWDPAKILPHDILLKDTGYIKTGKILMFPSRRINEFSAVPLQLRMLYKGLTETKYRYLQQTIVVECLFST